TSPSGEDAIFQAAGFLPELRVRVDDNRVLDRTTDDLVAWVFSASSTAPHLFGNKITQFEADLRELLDHTSPSGHFSVPLSDTTIRVRRPGGPKDPRCAASVRAITGTQTPTRGSSDQPDDGSAQRVCAPAPKRHIADSARRFDFVQ